LAYAAPNFGVIAKKLEFRVQKAKEFESFRQIPKYSHSPLAVIHPTPSKDERPVWKPPKNLGFDGSRVNVAPKRYEPRNIPDHLSRPTVDENKLMQIRANEKDKKKNVGKTMSLTAKKDGEAIRKKAHEL
jgi:hypothetical protein